MRKVPGLPARGFRGCEGSRASGFRAQRASVVATR